MRVLSLFSGAGGADLALEAAGFSVAALCEIEPHARAVLREHWPDVPLHGDVAQLDGTQYRGAVDVVVGGSPCQDLSVAGKRAGLTEGSGTRSSLFYEQVRIWNESGAPYLIWENVKGAFSSSQGADFAAVLSAIVGRPVAVPVDGWKRKSGGVVCGPTAVAAWRLLDLQHFGVPQRRERIVVLAARAGGVDPAEVLAVGESLSRDSSPRFQAREGTTRDAAPRPDQASAVLTYDARGNGNGVVAFDTTQITSPANYSRPKVGDACHPLAATAHVPLVLTFDARGNGDGHIVNTMAGDHQNRVTDYTALVLGSGESVTATLTADYGDKMGLNDQHIYSQKGGLFAMHLGVPRRLMPIECERLMGWPDDWTRWGVNEKGVRYELADTPRYRLCGNGIGREWMEWIALRLMEAVMAADEYDRRQEVAA